MDRIKSPSTNLPPAVEDDEPQFIEEGDQFTNLKGPLFHSIAIFN